MISSNRSDSKRRIIESINRQTVPKVDLPSLDETWIEYDDVVAKFAESVATVGGQAIECDSLADVADHLEKIAAFKNGTQILSTVQGLDVGNVQLGDIDDPHDLADLDFAIFQGEFAVAENGAVWLDAGKLKHRVVYFIPQHLSLVVERASLLNNMHQAYQRLEFNKAKFGVFLSGPSKTADIEQSLVIGAHGARSLTVFVVA